MICSRNHGDFDKDIKHIKDIIVPGASRPAAFLFGLEARTTGAPPPLPDGTTQKERELPKSRHRIVG
jgi:hypothetical protein